MTAKLHGRSTHAPQVLRTRSTVAPQTCVSGREGKGMEEEWRTDVSLHASTDCSSSEPIGTSPHTQPASMHGRYAASTRWSE